MALHPVLARRSRLGLVVLGAAWTGLMAQAVIAAHWHLPLDTMGSVLLSVGVIAAGGAFFERTVRPAAPASVERELVRAA
jgi:hypothetical protein